MAGRFHLLELDGMRRPARQGCQDHNSEKEHVYLNSSQLSSIGFSCFIHAPSPPAATRKSPRVQHRRQNRGAEEKGLREEEAEEEPGWQREIQTRIHCTRPLGCTLGTIS